MASQKGFRIRVTSPFEEFWRYNVALAGGLFDNTGQRIGFASTEHAVADVGANLKHMPDDYPRNREIALETAPCDKLRLLIYLIPHTLPLSNRVADCRPFPLHVEISYDGRELRTEHFDINQWSGASIERMLRADGSR